MFGASTLNDKLYCGPGDHHFLWGFDVFVLIWAVLLNSEDEYGCQLLFLLMGIWPMSIGSSVS